MTVRRKYSWTKSYGVPAQIVGEFWDGLPDKSPEAFVKASSNRRAPTHSLFEWDDSAAAQRYRLLQACTITSSLHIEIIDKQGKAQTVRAFITSSNRGKYVATLEASPEELTAAEERCVNEMRTFKQRWKSLQLAREVIYAMQTVEQRVSRKRSKRAA
jgi:hypothetical protein